MFVSHVSNMMLCYFDFGALLTIEFATKVRKSAEWKKTFRNVPEFINKYILISTKARKIVVELNKICHRNVVTQYGNQLYTQKT